MFCKLRAALIKALGGTIHAPPTKPTPHFYAEEYKPERVVVNVASHLSPEEHNKEETTDNVFVESEIAYECARALCENDYIAITKTPTGFRGEMLVFVKKVNRRER